MISLAQALADLFVTAFVVGLLSFLFGRMYQEWLYRADFELPAGAKQGMVAEHRASLPGRQAVAPSTGRCGGTPTMSGGDWPGDRLPGPSPLQDAGGHVRVVSPLYDWEGTL